MTLAYEQERLAALRALDVLDTPPEDEFEAIVAGARHLFNCPIAVVTMVDSDRVWFKARWGVEDPEAPRNASICNHVIDADDMLVVRDAAQDPRFANYSHVGGPPSVRFYAGVPLRVASTNGGMRLPIGTLCVVDVRPRDPSPAKLKMLRGMGDVIEALLESRRSSKESLRVALERHEALIEIKRTQRLLQHAERMAQIGSWRLDLATEQVHWSAQTYTIYGLAPEGGASLDGALDPYPGVDRARMEAAMTACVAGGASWDLELDFVTGGGELRRVRSIGEAESRDGQVVALIGVLQDITDRYKLERRLHEVAHTDELTGLASRRAFNERLDAAIAERRADGTPVAVAILDLDRFKEVNDRLGHAAGDEVLRLTAAKLRALSYMGDHFAARFGGDEFVLLLRGAHARERLTAGVARLLDDLRHDVPVDGGSITVSTTVGVGIVDDDGDSRSTLLQAADQALYRAKELSRGTAAIAGRPGVIGGTGGSLPLTRSA